MTVAAWRTIQKLESKSDRWRRGLFIVRVLDTMNYTWQRHTMLTAYHRVAWKPYRKHARNRRESWLNYIQIIWASFARGTHWGWLRRQGKPNHK